MTSFQKVIKYASISFAFVLVLGIIVSVFVGAYTIVNIFDGNKNEIENEPENISCNFTENIRSLDIDTDVIDLKVLIGSTFNVKTNNKNIKCKQDSDVLKIKESSTNGVSSKNKVLEVQIPRDYLFDYVDIDSDIGKIYVESINSKIFNFDLGAGDANIDYINSGDVDVENGAGNFSINSGTIGNFQLDQGVGKVSINAYLRGISKIEGGVGKLDINLLGNKDDYRIAVEKGVGSIKIDGFIVNNNNIIGSGNSKVNIDGGVGEISINFKND